MGLTTLPNPKGVLKTSSPKSIQTVVVGTTPTSPSVHANQTTIEHNNIINGSIHRNGNVGHQIDGGHPKLQTNSNQIGRIVNNGKLTSKNLNNNINSAVLTATKSVAANLPIDDNHRSVEALGVLIQYLVFDVSIYNKFFFFRIYFT